MLNLLVAIFVLVFGAEFQFGLAAKCAGYIYPWNQF